MGFRTAFLFLALVSAANSFASEEALNKILPLIKTSGKLDRNLSEAFYFSVDLTTKEKSIVVQNLRRMHPITVSQYNLIFAMGQFTEGIHDYFFLMLLNARFYAELINALKSGVEWPEIEREDGPKLELVNIGHNELVYRANNEPIVIDAFQRAENNVRALKDSENQLLYFKLLRERTANLFEKNNLISVARRASPKPTNAVESRAALNLTNPVGVANRSSSKPETNVIGVDFVKKKKCQTRLIISKDGPMTFPD